MLACAHVHVSKPAVHWCLWFPWPRQTWLQISALWWGMFGDETSVILLIKFVCVRKLLKVFIHETVQKSLALQKTKASSREVGYMPMMLVYTVLQTLFSNTCTWWCLNIFADICIMHDYVYTYCCQCSQVHRLDANWTIGLRASLTKNQRNSSLQSSKQLRRTFCCTSVGKAGDFRGFVGLRSTQLSTLHTGILNIDLSPTSIHKLVA